MATKRAVKTATAAVVTAVPAPTVQPAVPIIPTTIIPRADGPYLAYNVDVANRNVQFSIWLEAARTALEKAGMKVEIYFSPGGNNWCYTLADWAWLVVDGWNMKVSVGTMVQYPNIMTYVPAMISNQKMSGGRVERDQ
jgi:hypothetical protein